MPDPTGVETASYYYIPKYTISNFSDGLTEIVDELGNKSFPEKYYEPLLMCIAIKILNRRLNDYLENDTDRLEDFRSLWFLIGSAIARFQQERKNIVAKKESNDNRNDHEDDRVHESLPQLFQMLS